MMIARSIWISAAILLYPVTGWAAGNNFWCSPSLGVCSCDINERTDCGLLRKNCKNETFTGCVGTKCFCRLDSAVKSVIGNPPRTLPKGILQQLPSLRQKVTPVQSLGR